MANLKNMNREQLNAEAARVGIADAETLDKNADVIAAIEGSETYQAEQEAAARDAAVRAATPPAPKPPVYLVNGVKVDPNGKPVG